MILSSYHTTRSSSHTPHSSSHTLHLYTIPTLIHPIPLAQFLSGLAMECDDVSLNPNELRAVIAIVQAIATRTGEEHDGVSALTKG